MNIEEYAQIEFSRYQRLVEAVRNIVDGGANAVRDVCKIAARCEAAVLGDGIDNAAVVVAHCFRYIMTAHCLSEELDE